MKTQNWQYLTCVFNLPIRLLDYHYQFHIFVNQNQNNLFVTLFYCVNLCTLIIHKSLTLIDYGN